MDHALELVVVTLAAQFAEKGRAATLMQFGTMLLTVVVVLFPGSLYGASFGGPSILASVGGFAAMGGWALFGIGALSSLLGKRTYL